MIRVEIVNVLLTEKGGEFIVLLKGEGDPRTLPISIGQLEAQSIAMELYRASSPRPLTHDLFKSTLEKLGSQVSKVIVCNLVDNTFYARLFLETDGKSVEIDARPSDAIALALRFSAPVFVEEKVMDESGVIFPPDKQNKGPKKTQTRTGIQRDPKKAPEVPPLESLKGNLARAVENERYEDAAKIRDEINKLTKSN
jgi:uncharacterized protein